MPPTRLVRWKASRPAAPASSIPIVPGSAQLGWSTGPYVLNLLVQASPNPPGCRGFVARERSGARPGSNSDHGAILRAGRIFSSSPSRRSRRKIKGRSPRSLSRVPTGQSITRDSCRMIERRTRRPSRCSTAWGMARWPGEWLISLHLSGPGGLTDLGGNPLEGNDSERRLRDPLRGVWARPRHIGQRSRRIHDRLAGRPGWSPADWSPLSRRAPGERHHRTLSRFRHGSGILRDGGRLRHQGSPGPELYVQVERR